MKLGDLVCFIDNEAKWYTFEHRGESPGMLEGRAAQVRDGERFVVLSTFRASSKDNTKVQILSTDGYVAWAWDDWLRVMA